MACPPPPPTGSALQGQGWSLKLTQSEPTSNHTKMANSRQAELQPRKLAAQVPQVHSTNLAPRPWLDRVTCPHYLWFAKFLEII